MEVDINNVELLATVDRQVETTTRLLNTIASDYSPATLANSLGAEDMVLTDIIMRKKLPIEIFSLDTGRLPTETYDLMQRLKRHYGLTLKFYFPRHDLVESFVRENGINGFYESIDLRKACCHARKVEPLQRALAGKKAWITGMRAEQSETRAELPVRVFDSGNGLEKFNPLTGWTEAEVWAYIKTRDVPYNRLHDKGYPSIGCAPCTRAVATGEHVRSGRWWWEDPTGKECGLHVIPVVKSAS
jgi:phosphoadenosine phosphosulfate reductase